MIRKAALLGRDDWFEGLVQITDAGAGNGWLLDLTAPAGVPLVRGDHDAAEPLGAVLESAELLFGDMTGNVVERQSELGELVAGLLRTGRMPKARRG